MKRVDALMGLCDQLEAAQRERETRRDRLVAASLTRLNQHTGANARTIRPLVHFHLDQIARFTTRPEHIKQLRQTILSFAIRGKLVTQDPADEPAMGMLRRIQAEKERLAKECKMRADAAIVPLAAEEGRHAIPIGWEWVSLGQIMISRDGERVPISRDDRSRRAKIYDYYGASGIIDQIDGYIYDKPLLLIGEDGANLINRSTPIAFIARGKYWVNNHAHVLDGISEAFLRFIELYINAIDLRPYVTGAAQPKMNQGKMNSIPVAFPPEAEQCRIVARVDELMALCNRLEASLATGQSDSRHFLEALIHAALESADAAVPAWPDKRQLDSPPSAPTSALSDAREAIPSRSRLVQGERVLLLKLLLEQSPRPLDRNELELGIVLALTTTSHKRIASRQSVGPDRSKTAAATNYWPGLDQELDALRKNGVIGVEVRGDQQFFTLKDRQGLDTKRAAEFRPMVIDALRRSGRLKDRRELSLYLTEAEREELETLLG